MYVWLYGYACGRLLESKWVRMVYSEAYNNNAGKGDGVKCPSRVAATWGG